jgi:hypothetical protein
MGASRVPLTGILLLALLQATASLECEQRGPSPGRGVLGSLRQLAFGCGSLELAGSCIPQTVRLHERPFSILN